AIAYSHPWMHILGVLAAALQWGALACVVLACRRAFLMSPWPALTSAAFATAMTVAPPHQGQLGMHTLSVPELFALLLYFVSFAHATYVVRRTASLDRIALDRGLSRSTAVDDDDDVEARLERLTLWRFTSRAIAALFFAVTVSASKSVLD